MLSTTTKTRMIGIGLVILGFVIVSCSEKKRVGVSSLPVTAFPTLTPSDEDMHTASNLDPQETVFNTCPITAIQHDFWEGAGSVAGEFPVWISSSGQMHFSELGPKVLPGESFALNFKEGRSTKRLIFVDEQVEGDLLITGSQLDGNGKVYFPDDDQIVRVDESTLQFTHPPSDFKLIHDAHISTHFPAPEGKSHLGMGLVFTNPGCYELTAAIGEYVVHIVFELIDGQN